MDNNGSDLVLGFTRTAVDDIVVQRIAKAIVDFLVPITLPLGSKAVAVALVLHHLIALTQAVGDSIRKEYGVPENTRIQSINDTVCLLLELAKNGKV